MGTQADAVVPVQAGEDLGRLPSQNLEQGQLRVFQHGHLRPGRPGRGRRLQTDPSAADHHDPRTLGEGGLQTLAVAHAPQIQHVVQVRPRDGQAAR